MADAPRFQRHPATVWRRSFDAVLLLPPNSTAALTVTNPGAFLWQQLAEPITIDTLADRLAQQYGIEVDAARHDTAAVLESLVDASAVVVVAPVIELDPAPDLTE